MKILMVNKFLYPRGGAESYMFGIGKRLEDTGHEVEYFGMYDEKNIVENKDGLYTQNMDFHTSSLKKLFYPFKIIYSLEAKKKIGKVIDRMKPDVIHLNNINFQLTPSIIDAAKKRGVPVVWTVHDYQLICPNHLLYNEQKGEICEKCVGKGKAGCIRDKCIHGSTVKSIIGAIEANFYKHRSTYKNVDAFICPSAFLRSKLLEGNSELFGKKAVVIRNYVTEKKLPEKAKSNFDFPYVAFAGRLSEEKGIDVLRQTAELLPDVKFVVMGNGPKEQTLKGIKNIIRTGFLTGDELTANIAFANALLVPSVWYENCPMSILEAYMLGVPCVAVNKGGMAELIENGVTGVLSKDASAESYAEAVKDILSDNRRLLKMKENCLKAAGECLSVETYCDELLKIYEYVVGKR